MKRETEAPRTFPVRGAFSSRGLGRGPNRCGSPPPSRYRWAPWSPPSRPSCGCGWSPRRCRRRCSPRRPGWARERAPAWVPGSAPESVPVPEWAPGSVPGWARASARVRAPDRGPDRDRGRPAYPDRPGCRACRAHRVLRAHPAYPAHRACQEHRACPARQARRALRPLAAGALRRLAARAGLGRARPGHDRLIQVHARLALHQGERSASPPIRWLSRPVPGGTAPRTARRPP